MAVKNHAHGARNPLAHFQQPVTLEEVMESRMVADPLRLLHCCPISDGAAAIVLTARAHARPRRRASGRGRTRSRCAIGASSPRSRATRAAAREAFAMAGFGPERVDFAEIHDAFAPFELISLEDTGLLPPGKAGRATLDGETALDGRLPINPSGGLKARGHPLAATGAGPGRRMRLAAHRPRPGPPGPRRPARPRPVHRRPRHQQLGDAPGGRVIETIAASRCPRCATLVAPPATYCPHHPVAMDAG